MVFGGRRVSPLAWEVTTAGSAAIHGTVTYVSATTGRILAHWSTVDTANDVGKGKTEYSGTVKLNDIKHGGTYTLQDNKRGKQQIYNANHTGVAGRRHDLHRLEQRLGRPLGDHRRDAGRRRGVRPARDVGLLPEHVRP